MSKQTGRCLCGKCSYIVTDVQKHIHACHCGMCRRWSGGPGFAVTVSSLEFGDDSNVKTYASSDWAERGFCAECGTNLFYRTRDGRMTLVWMGTLDEQDDIEVVGEIYIDAKPPGYAMAGDHPRQTEDEFLKSIGMK